MRTRREEKDPKQLEDPEDRMTVSLGNSHRRWNHDELQRLSGDSMKSSGRNHLRWCRWNSDARPLQLRCALLTVLCTYERKRLRLSRRWRRRRTMVELRKTRTPGQGLSITRHRVQIPATGLTSIRKTLIYICNLEEVNGYMVKRFALITWTPYQGSSSKPGVRITLYRA